MNNGVCNYKNVDVCNCKEEKKADFCDINLCIQKI